jgi:hypothetical protein
MSHHKRKTLLDILLTILGSGKGKPFSRSRLLRVEALEERCNPDTVTWTGGAAGPGGSPLWSMVGNWDNRVPLATDTVVFNNANAAAGRDSTMDLNYLAPLTSLQLNNYPGEKGVRTEWHCPLPALELRRSIRAARCFG